MCGNIQRYYQLIRSATGRFLLFKKKELSICTPFLILQTLRGHVIATLREVRGLCDSWFKSAALARFKHGMVEKTGLKPRSSFRNVPVTIGYR